MKKPNKESGALPMLTRLSSNGQNDGIEDQESRGQQQFINSSSLPTKGLVKEDLEKIGFTVIGVFKDDPLFTEVVFPKGWTKQVFNRLASRVLDERGIERISCFYKAAFYDRRASMGVYRRFDVYMYGHSYLNNDDHLTWEDEDYHSIVVIDRLKSSVIFELKKDKEATFKEEDVLMEQCYEWLNEHYPKWDDVTEYWYEREKQ